jgi:hypothetical protein
MAVMTSALPLGLDLEGITALSAELLCPGLND